MNRILGLSAIAVGVFALWVAPAVAGPINVAASANGGVASASSSAFGGTPDRVNDGNRNGLYFGSNSVAHTASQTAGEWMQVTFDNVYFIGHVNVFNRTDCCTDRVDPFRVSLFNGATEVYGIDVATFVPNIQGVPNGGAEGGFEISGMTIDVPDVLANRFRVTILSNNFLNLAELEAVAIPEASTFITTGLLAMSFFGIRRFRRKH